MWLEHAIEGADDALRLFFDGERGGFFTTGSDAEELVARPKDLLDNAIPSANSVLALQLQRLFSITGRDAYLDAAERTLRLVAEVLGRAPSGFGHMLEAVDYYASEALEIVIVGDSRTPGTLALVEPVRHRYLPNKVLVVSEASTEDVARIPLLAGRAGAEQPTAYVCRRGTCRLPVTSPEDLVAQLAAPQA
jgi:uncharacterized protein